jgi:hypothetical protein
MSLAYAAGPVDMLILCDLQVLVCLTAISLTGTLVDDG